jgi:DNA-binding CsgD family transcriptional regulator
VLEINVLGAHYTFDGSRDVVIGRGEGSDVVVNHESVSRRHVVLTFVNERWRAADDRSTNGTFYEGQRITTIDVPSEGSLWLAHPRTGIEICLLAPQDGYATVRLADDSVGDSEAVAPSPPMEIEDYGLTARERQVIALVAGGATDAHIAGALFISVRTVRSHLDRIQGKTGRRRRFDVTRLAYELGIEPTSSPTPDEPR